MFIFSFSAKKISKKTVILLVILLAAAAISAFIIFSLKSDDGTINYEGGSYRVAAKNISEMKDFAGQFGWEITSEPLEVKEIIIPSEFNSVYEHYNDIQKQQGLDLSKYKGEKCKEYTFGLLNYPNNDEVDINIIILNDRVIGGDISETIMDGFMKNFTGI